MLLRLLLLLILAPGREQSREAPKAVLLLDPPWSTTFKGQRVTLICKDFYSQVQGDTYWYYVGKALKKKGKSTEITDSGDYRCKSNESSISDAVHVEFSSDALILQAPYPVFEGDNIDLRCKEKEETKMSEKKYYKNGRQLYIYDNKDCISLTSVHRDHDSGTYYCSAKPGYFRWTVNTKSLRLQVQELFPHPKLIANSSRPIEGNPVTLTCETQLSPQRPNVQIQFCFFRSNQVLKPGCSSSPQLQISAMWTENSGPYWCEARAVSHIRKESLRIWISVRRVRVSDVNLEVQPSGGQLVEGEMLVLICSVARGTGNITFSWHREGAVSLGKKTQRSLLTELRVPNVKVQDAGRYYCTANNGYGPLLSRRRTVTVRVPVSPPILTLRAPRAQAVVGDILEFHCEAPRGSAPIWYQFYHENVILWNSSAPSGGGASFNLSLTAEHSGSYSCEADNGLGTQHSHRLSLNVIVPVTRPILTLRGPRAQAVEGDVLELFCEALSGSPPVLYRFYYEDVTLWNDSAPNGGGIAFNLTLTAEQSGNYSCEADNGLGAQQSEVVTLRVTGTSRNQTGLISAGVIGGLLSILGLIATAALMNHFRTQRKSGLSTTNTSRPFRTDPQEPTHSEPLAQMELQPVYNNVNPEKSTLIYSQVWSFQRTQQNAASSTSLDREGKEPSTLYSEVKKIDQNKCTEPGGSAHEDAAEYENLPHAQQPQNTSP
ncbi:Fc receptor-like protein 3 isoform X1 [Tupaia chinensis]|uniref:Fc receptor-like protein 3 isoform X1 n=1 Tax=Tupaia chinensis TaxID=246437 RepID=UPI0003C8CE27|nr:Fc receptor-like protein 3 isoform X1 [Tupaia chinensis]